jgi:hypothetical protein
LEKQKIVFQFNAEEAADSVLQKKILNCGYIMLFIGEMFVFLS